MFWSRDRLVQHEFDGGLFVGDLRKLVYFLVRFLAYASVRNSVLS